MRQWVAGVFLLWIGTAVLVPVFLIAVSRTRPETNWTHLSQFIRGVQGADSWKPMEIARADAATGRDGLYERVFFAQHIKFQYPPTALLAIGPLGRPALNRLSWWATLATATLSGLLLTWSTRRSGASGSTLDGLALSGVATLLALAYYPLLKAYTLGQIQVWIDLLIVILVWSVAAGWWGASGGALAAACLLKPTYGLVALWGLSRRQWSMLATFCAVSAGVLIVSIGRFGLANHLAYLDVLSYIGSRGESFVANQSFNGLLHRALFNGPNLEWSYDSFAPYSAVVATGTWIAFAGLVGVAFVLPRLAGHAGTPLDLAIMLTTVTVTAPVAWEHHYGVLLPLFALLAPVLVRDRALGRYTALVLALVFMVTASELQFPNRFAHTAANVLQSYLLGAALVWLGLLYVQAWSIRPDERPERLVPQAGRRRGLPR